MARVRLRVRVSLSGFSGVWMSGFKGIRVRVLGQGLGVKVSVS